MLRSVHAGLAGLGVFLFACGGEPGSSGESPSTGSTESDDPGAPFQTLEERLMEAGNVMMRFRVTAEGAVTADLEGGFQSRRGGSTKLTASGTFAGEDVDLLLISDGQSYEFGRGPERTRAPQPTHLHEALFIGFTRMGFLHNLARLVGGAAPDAVDGGVREWVVVDSFTLQSGRGESQVISFALTVGGEPSGSATLEIGAGGLPLIRRQTVQFPSGEMQVVERYEAVAITP